MKLKAYKSNLGLFIKQDGYSSYSSYKLNGVDVKHPSGEWLFLKDVHHIDFIEVMKKGSPKHVGYTLKIASIASDEIPLNLSLDDVQGYTDDDDDFVWKHYTDFQALYKFVHEPTADVWEQISVEVEVVREIKIDNYDEPIKMSVGTQVRMQEPSWNSSDDLSKVVLYEDIERILTPEFLLHERPCQLSPGQVYSIVRNWIKLNINPKAAFISSDYDFCFTVKRRIAIKPLTIKTEIKKQNGRSYASPKFNTKTQLHKEEVLFEMAPKGYQSYPVIEQWHASSLKEMAAQLKSYLDALMEEINTEAEECSHCKGLGAIVNRIGTNERA